MVEPPHGMKPTFIHQLSGQFYRSCEICQLKYTPQWLVAVMPAIHVLPPARGRVEPIAGRRSRESHSHALPDDLRQPEGKDTHQPLLTLVARKTKIIAKVRAARLREQGSHLAPAEKARRVMRQSSPHKTPIAGVCGNLTNTS